IKQGKIKEEDVLNSDEEDQIDPNGEEIDIDRWKDMKKKSIEPLPPIDHSKIEYEKIEKNFYNEAEEVSAMNPLEINKIRKEKDIRVRGYKVKSPITSFSQLRVDPPLLRKLEKLGFTSPTPIQCQAIPEGPSGRDIFGIAK